MMSFAQTAQDLKNGWTNGKGVKKAALSHTFGGQAHKQARPAARPLPEQAVANDRPQTPGQKPKGDDGLMGSLLLEGFAMVAFGGLIPALPGGMSATLGVELYDMARPALFRNRPAPQRPFAAAAPAPIR